MSRPGDRRFAGLGKKALSCNYQSIHPTFVDNHLRILCSLRDRFGNDIDKPIILGLIGQMMFNRLNREGVATDVYHDLPEGEGDRGVTNVESISMCTSIPRETVRRKVSELIDEGLVERMPKGRLLVTAQAAQELSASAALIGKLLDDVFNAIAIELCETGILRIERLDLPQGGE